MRQTALVRNAVPALESCPAGEAIILRHDPGRVLLRANANCRGILTLADTDDNGWKVKVDGKGATKLSTFNAWRGVVLEKGEHTVEWCYQPNSVILGAALSFLGFLAPVLQTLVQSLLAKRRRVNYS